jgi:Kef-type K+ transport system membrane component KefB
LRKPLNSLAAIINIMSDRKINVFYMISFICTIVLIAYVGLVFLPEMLAYVGQLEAEPVITVISIIIVLLIIAACLQLFLLVKSLKK